MLGFWNTVVVSITFGNWPNIPNQYRILNINLIEFFKCKQNTCGICNKNMLNQINLSELEYYIVI